VGLRFPADLAAWQRWQEGRHPLRRLTAALRAGPGAPGMVLHTTGSDPHALVAVDSVHGTHAIALLEPLRHLDSARVAVLAPTDVTAWLPPGDWSSTPFDPMSSEPPAPRVVLAVGDFLSVGAYGRALADRSGADYIVAQHGLLTPYAPPLPRAAHLLAFSDADAAFWVGGRTDVRATVVGSQLLWSAADRAAAVVPPDAAPVYLGQLHAAELSRTRLARAAAAFCAAHGAVYRPHPSERDRISRLLHAVWRRRGIRVDGATVPLADLAAPVVSVFSTGVLEAAARGLPAWVDFPDPPAWLREFWDRYAMRQYGGDPTPSPARPDEEPAAAIARLLAAS